MPEEKGRSIVNRLVERLMDSIFGSIRKSVERQIDEYVRKLMRILALTIVGVVLVSAGLVFILRGIVVFLGELMPIWLAWSMVGIIVVLIGGIAFLSVRRR